jgi:hypothetical protein
MKASNFLLIFWISFCLDFPLFGLGPSSKGLRTNLKLLTNKIAWIHWSLDVGPWSKVTLSFTTCFSILYLECTYIPLYHSVFFFFFLFFFSILQFVNFVHFLSIFFWNSHYWNEFSQFLQKHFVATVQKFTKKNHCSVQNFFCFLIWCHYKVEWDGMIRSVGNILNFVYVMKLEKSLVRVWFWIGKCML